MTQKPQFELKMEPFAGDLKTTKTTATIQFQNKFSNIEKNTQKFKKILLFLMTRKMIIDQIKEKAQLSLILKGDQ